MNRIPEELKNVLWKETDVPARFCLVFGVARGSLRILVDLCKYYDFSHSARQIDAIVKQLNAVEDENNWGW